MREIKQLLGAEQATSTWLEQLEAVGAPDFEVALPAADELPSALLQLAVPHEDINGLVAQRAAFVPGSEAWWLLERCVHTLVREIGEVDERASLPALPASLRGLERHFYVFVFLALLPHVRHYHRRRRVPDDVSRLTLADLGRQMVHYRRAHGVSGFDAQDWIRLHFRGALYELGRLQFERARLGKRTGRAIAAAGQPYGPGDACLSVHIPAYYGPLTPSACDTSIARARSFFATHFEDERYAVAVCHSWLLDAQLAEYLPPHSNIVRFQQRFRTAYRFEDDDRSVLRFVFGRDAPLEELPRDSALERAILDHLAAGRHWRGAAGWLLL